ncbi:MXAN_6627.5 family MYXO-CTERM protein [Myxococcus sp. Y35]|uniref:MXAN_6627.5 family MYXO-CTERM protein n=1 Tax=Pseudomyxococcus flavus TaxID=3115648 RepID=UPI003CF667B2
MSPAPIALRSRLRGLLACLPLLLPVGALAQSDGGLDAGLPDASVGEGGADRDNPEGDDNTGRVNTSCRSTRDCSPRFSCDNGFCRYTGVRQVDQQGCVLGAQAALVIVGLAAVGGYRRRR